MNNLIPAVLEKQRENLKAELHNVKEASIIGSFSINDRKRQRQRHKLRTSMIDRVWKINRAARAARSYEQVRAFLCKIVTAAQVIIFK